MLNIYDKYLKHGKYASFNATFDVTEENGEWVCSEDGRLYYLHIGNKGHFGNGTVKVASSKTIPPT